MNCGYKSYDGHLEEVVVGVTYWEFKSYLFKALMLPAFTYGVVI